jgi:hypothetical protein
MTEEPPQHQRQADESDDADLEDSISDARKDYEGELEDEPGAVESDPGTADQ